MLRAGEILFALGLLAGVAGAAKLPAEGARWPDTWPVAVGGVLAGIAGVVIWHLAARAARRADRDAREAGGGGVSAAALLAGLVEPARALRDAAPTLDTEALRQRAEALLEAHVLPFAEVRHQILEHLGMARGADVLVTVAYGERLLNRVWSAAADGHLEEARACVPEAADAFEEAAAMLEAGP